MRQTARPLLLDLGERGLGLPFRSSATPISTCDRPPGLRLSTVRCDAIAASNGRRGAGRTPGGRTVTFTGSRRTIDLPRPAPRRGGRATGKVSSSAEHVEVRRIERQRTLEVRRCRGQIIGTIHRDPAEDACAGA